MLIVDTFRAWLPAGCAALLLAGCGAKDDSPTTAPQPMLQPLGAAWHATLLLAIGSDIDGYAPPGKPDGLGVFASDGATALLVNHELDAGSGPEYRLANGTSLRGARISRIELDPATRRVLRAGIAYDAVYDRADQPVTRAAQINETGSHGDGLSRLCSARAVSAGQYHFEDDIFFSGEEVSRGRHPHGGTLWALDMHARTLWPVNAVGRGAWENVSPLEHPDPARIALLAASDITGAPLYLYVGEKGGADRHDFLDRNGLRAGTLYCWRADDGVRAPRDFHGTGAARDGRWVALRVQGGAACPGTDDCDDQGYLNSDALQRQALQQGCFSFSRPEDLHDNPADPRLAVFASTGNRSFAAEDAWGTLYVVDTDLGAMTARLRILHDADTLADPGAGIRNPDNLTWAGDAMIYVQEDAADARFADVSEHEAGIWRLDPATGAAQRIAVIARRAVWPPTAADARPAVRGAWESSGVIDVTADFPTAGAEILLLTTVQAHTLRGGAIADQDLVEGGQILWLSHRPDVH